MQPVNDEEQQLLSGESSELGLDTPRTVHMPSASQDVQVEAVGGSAQGNSTRWGVRVITAMAVLGCVGLIGSFVQGLGASKAPTVGSGAPVGAQYAADPCAPVVATTAAPAVDPCAPVPPLVVVPTTITTTITVTTTITTSTTTSTTTTSTTYDCGGEVTLNFTQADKTHNNLNNVGPDSGDKYIRFSKMGKHDGKYFDMIVSSPTDTYVPPPGFAKWNGVYGDVGIIYITSPSLAELKFNIVESGTKTAMVLPKFFFTALDIDTATPGCLHTPKPGEPKYDSTSPNREMGYNNEECKAMGLNLTNDQTQSPEVLTAWGFDEYLLGPKTDLAVTKLPGDKTQFQATLYGDETDNPWEPMNMTEQQQNRAITFVYRNTHEFFINYESEPGGRSPGREVFFAGKSQLALLPCMPPTPADGTPVAPGSAPPSKNGPENQKKP